MAKTKPKPRPGPVEVAKEGSISVPIYATTNRIYRRDPVTGQNVLKSEHSQFTLSYYEGSRRVKRKFTDLVEARVEAKLAAIKLANGQSEALRLTGTDRGDYVRAMERLRARQPNADLNVVIIDYVAAISRLPENVTLKEVVDSFLKRHPAGLPAKMVGEVLDDLIDSKHKGGQAPSTSAICGIG